MKKISTILLLFIIGAINVNAEIYLISSRAIKDWASVEHKGHWFTTTYNAFPDFESLFNSEYFNPSSKPTIYVDSDTFSKDITINYDGLTILGNNAFSDWTAARNEESIITGNIYIKASNVTINGFKFTGNGRIESSNGTNAKPLSGIKVLHNYFTGSTLERDNSNPLVEIGYMVGNENASTVSAQCRYKDCEVSHNYFEGDATHYACCISMGGVYGTTTVIDNYFYDGGTSLWIANAQGTLNIKNNVFKNVGKTTFTAPDGGNKGDFCIAIYRSAFANSTTANIVANEFEGCYGQQSAFPLIRIFQGGSGSTNEVQPVNFRVNVNENTFKNKSSVTPTAAGDQYGAKLLLFNDKTAAGKKIKYNISNNHFDNRFYKFAYVTLDDGLGAREVYADQFTLFDLGGSMSDFYTSLQQDSKGENIDVSYHAKSVSLKEASVLQSFDIDPLTGDMYFIQKMVATSNNNYNSKYGFSSSHDGLCVTRVPCNSFNVYSYTYSNNIEYMNIGYGGHGMKLCLVRDKNGQPWLWSGGMAEIISNDDISTSTVRWKFKNGTDINFNTGKDTDDAKYFDETSGDVDYPAVDETSRYLCIRTVGSNNNTYHIYNLDDALEGEKTLLKKVTLSKGEYKQNNITNDNGYNTWAFQSFDIKGDYIYTLEGTTKGTAGNISSDGPTVVLTLYNWRTNTYVYRKSINYGRINELVDGQPQGIVIRPDEYGHACMYLAFVNGNEGARKVNIFKFIIDYHSGYDVAKGSATIIGGDTSTKAHFVDDYSGNSKMNYSCDTKSINLETTSVGGSDSKTITIDNGEYVFGEWYGVITGDDSEAFTVKMNSNNAFSETATATVTFSVNSKNTSKTSYNAYLRLFSPLASTNVESNDIVIPLTGSYTGPTTDIEPNHTNQDVAISVNNKILSVENSDAKEIKVYASTGALVASAYNSNTIDLSHLSGMYIVNIITTNSTTHSNKIIVK